MILSDRSMREELARGRIRVEPLADDAIQPSSIDLRLGDKIRVFRNNHIPHIDLRQDTADLTEVIGLTPGQPFYLRPNEFALGVTEELIAIPNDLVGRLDGKALALDTPIPTPDGWRTMGELAVGDLVFDERGYPCQVVAATGVLHDRPCRKVSFSDGQAIIADAAHQWVVVDKRARNHGLPPAIRTTDELATRLRVDGGAEFNFHVSLAGPVRYPARPLPIDPYVLGAWLGDGAGTKSECTCADEEILAEIEQAGYAVSARSRPRLYRSGGVGHFRDATTGRYGANGSLSSTLKSVGVMGNKHVPAEYLIAGVQQRLALLQGLMDTDGYVDRFGCCEFVSTRECLADAVLELAASLGLRPVKDLGRATLYGRDCGPVYKIRFTTRVPVFRLPRKLARQKAGDGGHQFRAIASIEKVDSVPVRCIQVGTASGMFLAGKTFIPTHNSSLGRLGLLIHATAGLVDPGWVGRLTLELANLAPFPITLFVGMKIGQISFIQMTTSVDVPYGAGGLSSKYQGDHEPTPSRYHLEF